MKKNILYKTQIKGLLEVVETVRVIEKSAASYIHLLEKRVSLLLAYKERLLELLLSLSRFYWDNNHFLLKERNSGKKALLVISGEKGIVGDLYHRIISETIKKYKEYGNIWVIGKKGKEYLAQEGVKAEPLFDSLSFEGLPDSKTIRQMADFLFSEFKRNNLKAVDVIYAGFISLARQEPVFTQFLPFTFKGNNSNGVKERSLKESAEGFPIFEPSKKVIFEKLFKKYIDVFFTEIILEAKLSEFAARTVTAESAVEETERIIKRLTHEFFKMRRLEFTQKQIESFSVHKLTKT